MNEQNEEKKLPEEPVLQPAAEEEALPKAEPEEAEPPEAQKKEKACRKEKQRETEKNLALSEAAREKAEKELTEAKSLLMRTAAEYENYRKRATKEKEGAFNNGVGFAVNTLLPLIDTLESAEAAVTTDEEYKKGVTLTLLKCQEAFKLLGVEEIEALGAPFDPNLHSAVMQTDEGESGTVTRVLQKGYRLSGKVIRHAMVAVAN